MSDGWEFYFIDDPSFRCVSLQIHHKKTHTERTITVPRTGNESDTLAAALEKFAQTLRERRMNL